MRALILVARSELLTCRGLALTAATSLGPSMNHLDKASLTARQPRGHKAGLTPDGAPPPEGSSEGFGPSHDGRRSTEQDGAVEWMRYVAIGALALAVLGALLLMSFRSLAACSLRV